MSRPNSKASENWEDMELDGSEWSFTDSNEDVISCNKCGKTFNVGSYPRSNINDIEYQAQTHSRLHEPNPEAGRDWTHPDNKKDPYNFYNDGTPVLRNESKANERSPCEDCGGVGKIQGDVCEDCNGTGWGGESKASEGEESLTMEKAWKEWKTGYETSKDSWLLFAKNYYPPLTQSEIEWGWKYGDGVESKANEVPYSDRDKNEWIWTCPKCSQQIDYVTNKRFPIDHLRSHGLSDENIEQILTLDFSSSWKMKDFLNESKASEGYVNIDDDGFYNPIGISDVPSIIGGIAKGYGKKLVKPFQEDKSGDWEIQVKDDNGGWKTYEYGGHYFGKDGADHDAKNLSKVNRVVRKGSGYESKANEDADVEQCPECDGTGIDSKNMTHHELLMFHLHYQDWIGVVDFDCPRCNGTGQLSKSKESSDVFLYEPTNDVGGVGYWWDFELPLDESKERKTFEDLDIQYGKAWGYLTQDEKERASNYKSKSSESTIYKESWNQANSIKRIEALEKIGIKQGDAIKLSSMEFEDFGEDLQDALKGDIEDARTQMKQDKHELDGLGDYNPNDSEDAKTTGLGWQEGGEVENPNSEFQQYYPDYNNIGESQTNRTKYECEYCDHGFKSNEALMVHHNDKHAISKETLDGYATEDSWASPMINKGQTYSKSLHSDYKYGINDELILICDICGWEAGIVDRDSDDDSVHDKLEEHIASVHNIVRDYWAESYVRKAKYTGNEGLSLAEWSKMQDENGWYRVGVSGATPEIEDTAKAMGGSWHGQGGDGYNVTEWTFHNHSDAENFAQYVEGKSITIDHGTDHADYGLDSRYLPMEQHYVEGPYDASPYVFDSTGSHNIGSGAIGGSPLRDNPFGESKAEDEEHGFTISGNKARCNTCKWIYDKDEDEEWKGLAEHEQDHKTHGNDFVRMVGESKASELTDIEKRKKRLAMQGDGSGMDGNSYGMDEPYRDLDEESLANEAGLEDHSCPECGFITSDNSDYVDHLNTHEE